MIRRTAGALCAASVLMALAAPAMGQDETVELTMLGDVNDWNELKNAQSIILGSPDTVFKALKEMVEVSGVGNLLIQFHIGNMKNELARKSMRLFAEHVAPRLRAETSPTLKRNFPEMERELREAPV